MQEKCGTMDNGHGRCRRSDQIDQNTNSIAHERRSRQDGEHQILEAIGVLTGEVSDLVRRVGDAPNPNVGYEGSGLQRTIYRMAIRPSMLSFDYSETGETGETGNQELPALIARAKSAEAQVAALQARLDERDRHSDRVRDDRVERRRMVVAIVVAVLSSGALTWLGTWLVGG